MWDAVRGARILVGVLLLGCLRVEANAALVAPSFVLRHLLVNPGAGVQTNVQGGHSVALDGHLAVVGAPFADSTGTNSGSVMIYDASTGARLHSLSSPASVPGEAFGFAVALSHRRVVVGAPQNSTGANQAGTAYVHDLDAQTPGIPAFTLYNPLPVLGAQFGRSVAMEGARVVVGMPRPDSGSGRAYLFDLDGDSPEIPTLTLSDPGVGRSQFGSAVAIVGRYLVVGAPRDYTSGSEAGIAYVYDLEGTTPEAAFLTLTNPVPVTLGHFGESISVADTRLLIGAPGGFGTVCAYDLGGSNPAVPFLLLSGPNPSFGEQFGSAVAISGSRVAIGANMSNAGIPRAGAVHLFELNSTNPAAFILTITNPTPGFEDRFGISAAMAGSKLLVGASLDDAAGANSGSAYLFDQTNAAPGVPVAEYRHGWRVAGDNFARAVAVSGARVVIAAPRDDTQAPDAGRVYVYNLSASVPTNVNFTLQNPNPAAGDSFGNAVAISGARVIVGAMDDGTAVASAGSAYVYNLLGGIPTLPFVTLTKPNAATNEDFGFAVAIDGTWAAVGALWPTNGAELTGRVYLYNVGGGSPGIPVFALASPATSPDDAFGWSVAVSGTKVVVGAPWARSAGAKSGMAFVFNLAGPAPTMPELILTNPVSNSSAEFGRSVAIFGSQLVIGAPFENVDAPGAGRAYVYDLAAPTSAVPVATLVNPTFGLEDAFGATVSISGGRIVVGMPGADSGAAEAGLASVYDLATATPTVPIQLLYPSNPSTGSAFGGAVAIDGGIIVVGEPFGDTQGADRGVAHVYQARPMLDIVRTVPGRARVSWTPTNAFGYVLQTSRGLAPSVWTNAPSGATNPVTVFTTNSPLFFRLVQP